MDDLRSRVLQYLVTPGADTRFREAYLIRNVRAEAPGVSDAQAWEVLWALVADGLIYLNPSGQGSSTDNWRWLPSQQGIKVATTGQWEPRDPEGYLRRLRRHEPAVAASTSARRTHLRTVSVVPMPSFWATERIARPDHASEWEGVLA